MSSRRCGLGLTTAGALGIGCALVWDIPDREHDARVSCGAAGCTCADGFGDCDGRDDNGCETELEANEQHCGACGHDCQGGACSSGKCQPVQVVAAQRVTRIVIDDAHVYFTTGASGSLDVQETMIARAPRGGGAVEPLRTLEETFGPTSLQIRGGRLYWAEIPGFSKPSTIRTQLAAPGATPDTLFTKDESFPSLAVDDRHVYFISGFNTGFGPQEFALERVPLTGGAAESISIRPAVMLSPLLIDGDSAHWLEYGAVVSAPLDGGDVSVVPATQTIAMAIDDSNLYWLDRALVSPGKQRDTLWRRSKQDETVTVLVHDQSTTTQIASDGAHVFWTANAHSGGVASLMKVSVTGGEPEELARTSLEQGVNIVADDKALFWATPDAIMKLAK